MHLLVRSSQSTERETKRVGGVQWLSEDRPSLATFASAGLLIASILIFSLVALPELIPEVYPQFRYGMVGIRVVSTSGQLVAPQITSMDVVILSMAAHRVGIGEGAWVAILETPVRLDPMIVAQTPLDLEEKRIPVGDYNVVQITFGNVQAVILGRNVTIKVPTQELKIPTMIKVGEGKRSTVVLDLSFDVDAILRSERFDPYVTVSPELKGQGQLYTITELQPFVSLGPETLGPGDSASSSFTVEQGIDYYLVHAEGGSSLGDGFDLEIVETGEFWYDLNGELWFLGAGFTPATYTMIVSVTDVATSPVGISVNLYSVPRILSDVSNITFSGHVPSALAGYMQVNEFAVYLEKAGLYDFRLGVKSGDYEFLVDNNPVSIVSRDQTVTVRVDSGLHTFQVFTDFSGSGRDTSWSVGIIPVSGEPQQPLSREAMLSTGLLVIATVFFVADVSLRRLRRKRREPEISETSVNSEMTAGLSDLLRELPTL